jgi:hypothetical protein
MIFVMLLVYVFPSYSQQQQASVFNFLPGTWEMRHSKGYIIREVWEQKGSGLLIGASWKIVGADTLLSETIEVKAKGKKMFYTPTVKGHNREQPVPFRLVSSENNRFVFENKKHDFPQRIIYHFISPTQLKAIVEGITEGQSKKFLFDFEKQ